MNPVSRLRFNKGPEMSKHTRTTNLQDLSVQTSETTTAPPLEEQQPTTWIARVNLGRQMREAGEKMIADALAERRAFLKDDDLFFKECEDAFGWARSTVYNHLKVENLQKDRDRAKERRVASPDRLDEEKERERILAKAVEPIHQAIQAGRVRLVPDCAGDLTILKRVEPRPLEEIAADLRDLPLKKVEPATITCSYCSETYPKRDFSKHVEKCPGPQIESEPKAEPGPKSLTALAARPAERALPRGQQEAPPNPLVPENRIYLGDTALSQIRWGLESLEKNPRCLTPKRVEILGALWDRLSVVLENYGNDGGTTEDLDTTPETAAVDGGQP